MTASSAAPEKIVLSGEMYMEEDGWYGPGNSDNDYLHFRLESDGSRTYLFAAGIGNPGDAMFHENLEDALCDKSGEEFQQWYRAKDMEDPADPYYDQLARITTISAGRLDRCLGTGSADTCFCMPAYEWR